MGLTLIKSLTASGDSELEFIDGTDDVVMDNTYNEYQFYFVNIHPETNATHFEFQVNSTNDPGGGYDTSLITSTVFRAYHNEDDSTAIVTYRTGTDEANAANYQDLTESGSTEDDASLSGVLTIYDPSSTTYVKHFSAEINDNYGGAAISNFHVAGYINDYQYAIDEINFKMDSGNIDSGTIYMYGVG